MRNISEKVSERIKTHILCSISFFPKIVPFMRYMEKYYRTRQTTDENIIWCMFFARHINKARIKTHIPNI